MAVRIIGDHPLARDARGSLKSRVATLFIRREDLVTIPGVHATQRVAYASLLNQERKEKGVPSLTSEEAMAEWNDSVDLIIEGDCILIRPDPQNMELAFEADEILQQLMSKPRIQFLNAMDENVRRAIRQRGEYWRITALPRSPTEMKEMIHRSRIAIAEQPLYYYNMITGTRLITCGSFADLGRLDDAALARQLDEIRNYSARKNRNFNPEVDFFGITGSFGTGDFSQADFGALSPADLRLAHETLCRKFTMAVSQELRADDPDNAEWRNRLFASLIRRKFESVAEEIIQGLSPEFFLQIQWLPGGRIDGGELLFDPVFEELDRRPDDPELQKLCDTNAKAFFFNFIREFGNVEYVNIGHIMVSLGRRSPSSGRRDVYIAEIKLVGVERPVVRIIRMQKWGIRERLEENKDLLRSIMESEEYTEYILDRRLGCRQLGMNLPPRVTTGRIGEKYHGWRRDFEGCMIWATYFERDYVAGIATDKILPTKFESDEFALAFATLVGRAAAPNMIVGRLHLDGRVLFDDGDEVLLMDGKGLPQEVVVADHTGTFFDFKRPLTAFAEGYARPVNSRMLLVRHPLSFADAYVEAFTRQFDTIQREYRRKKRGFDSLFKHHKRDDEGCFAYRWESVLSRLDQTDPRELAKTIRSFIRLPGG
jgi:hypothetical protein